MAVVYVVDYKVRSIQGLFTVLVTLVVSEQNIIGSLTMIGFERKTRSLSNCVSTLIGFVVNVFCWINLSSAASAGGC